MSSISVRSYERRKSAGARLEPRSSLPPDEESKQKVKTRRVKSALETRKEHESSTEVFPGIERRKADPSWGITQYSMDYSPKKPIATVPVRPHSPTRKNNPHPSQNFLMWQYPTRIHKHKRAVPPDPDTWKLIHEGFYEDYFDDHNTGDARNEVPITNVAKIDFPGKKRKNGYTSTPQLIAGVSGTKAKLNPREGLHRSSGSHNPPRPVSPEARVIHNTVKGNTLPVFKDWLKSASHRERDVVLEMLKAAHDDSEDTRLQKAIGDVLQPDSAERVQGWLHNASTSDRQIVLHVLETLAVVAGDTDLYPELGDAHQLPHQRSGHRHRARSYPISLRQRSLYHDNSRYSSSGRYSRHLPSHPRSDHRHPAGSGVSNSSHMGLVVKKMAVKEKKPREEAPQLWQHRIKKPFAGASVVYAGSVWHQPKKDKGQHFTIHPEWPTA